LAWAPRRRCSARSDRYAASHFGAASAGKRRRFVALIGDAELDEGNVWEAISDETIRGTRLGNVLWIVDLNRQSLDRVIPGIKVQEMEALFRGIGWHVIETKYGRRLQALYARPGGAALRTCIDDMLNEEYQELVRLPGADARARPERDPRALAPGPGVPRRRRRRRPAFAAGRPGRPRPALLA
jgi:pyruvate dehydrogenase E1 component